MAYASAADAFDAARADQYRAEIGRAIPVTEGDAVFLYLTEVRGIPPETVLGCVDLRLLAAPIPGRDRTDFACVSLLRPAPGAEPTGAELAFVDILGRPSAAEPKRVQWAFVQYGCRNSWFWAGGGGARAYVSEGFSAKALATLSCGVPGWHLGWGARSWLQFKTLPPASIKTIIIVADRKPS